MAGAMVLGMQMIQLALLTKWMAVLAGIVPQPRWLKRSARFLNVETGLAGGRGLLGGRHALVGAAGL